MSDSTDKFLKAEMDEFIISDAPQPAVPPASAPAAPSAPAPAPAPVKFRREIDLGDGGGVQVFEADSPEALLDKLTEAQRHATAKIRALNQALKRQAVTRPPAPPKAAAPAELRPRPLSPDEEFVLGQKLTERPAQAFERLLEASLGVNSETLRNVITENMRLRQEIEEERAATEFVLAHKDDYRPTPENYNLIQDFLDSHGLPVTRDNLEYAFTRLSASGLLEASTPEPSAKPAPLPPASASVGLSDREQSQSPKGPDALTAAELAELRSLPLEEMRARIEQRLWQAKRASSPSPVVAG